MFINILPQRNWIKSVLLDENPRWKIWSKEKGIITRNKGFSSQNADNFWDFFIMIILSVTMSYSEYYP